MSQARYLYSESASLIQARLNCIASGNSDWKVRHEERIIGIVKNQLPSGSGIDSGTKLDLDKSHADKIVLHTAFHHMDEGGGYDGWTEHTITITPSLSGSFHLRISGRDRNSIKEYLADTYHYALMAQATAQ